MPAPSRTHFERIASGLHLRHHLTATYIRTAFVVDSDDWSPLWAGLGLGCEFCAAALDHSQRLHQVMLQMPAWDHVAHVEYAELQS